MTFVDAVLALAATITGYLKGRSGEGGLCDCIGLVIGALKRMGIAWGGTHGTNYAVRYKCRSPSPINGVDSLHIGDLVFKLHRPNESGYDAATIQKSYKNHPDQNDYYHVGVVISVYPLKIYHCSTGGIHIDTKIGKWAVRTTLKDLPESQEEGEKPVARTYFVYGGDTAYPIRMRKTASTSAAVIAQIPQNTVVDYLSVNGGWSKVIYEGKTGFVQSQYVHSTESGTVDTTFTDPLQDTGVRDLLDKWYAETVEAAKHTAKAQEYYNAIMDRVGRG